MRRYQIVNCMKYDENIFVHSFLRHFNEQIWRSSCVDMNNLSAWCVAVAQYENYLKFIRALIMMMNIQFFIICSYKLSETKAIDNSSQFDIMQKLTILGESFIRFRNLKIKKNEVRMIN